MQFTAPPPPASNVASTMSGALASYTTVIALIVGFSIVLVVYHKMIGYYLSLIHI